MVFLLQHRQQKIKSFKSFRPARKPEKMRILGLNGVSKDAKLKCS
jgi:hypothetical protein